MFYAVGDISGKLGATSISVTPGLVITARREIPGGAAAALGLGFGASEAVAVYWANPRQLLGTAFADSNGSFVDSGALKITIPTNAPLGSIAVVATGQTTGAVAIGKVIVE